MSNDYSEAAIERKSVSLESRRRLKVLFTEEVVSGISSSSLGGLIGNLELGKGLTRTFRVMESCNEVFGTVEIYVFVH